MTRPIGIERSGRAGTEAAESNAERALVASSRALGRRIDALDASLPYAPDPASWVAPPPTTIGEALDRIAAFIGPVP